MHPEEKQKFIFEQTVNLLSGLVAANQSLSPQKIINGYFEETYKALGKEFDKIYIKDVK